MSTNDGMANYIAKIGDKLYYSFEDANDASVSGDTILLLRDAVFTENTTLKDGVTLLVPPEITLSTGQYNITGGKVVSEAALDMANGDWTYYGSFLHALKNAVQKGDELYVYNNVSLPAGTNVVVPYGVTLIITTYAHLLIDGNMTVNGIVKYASEPCDVTVNGKLDIEGEFITSKASILFSNGEINLIGGKLRLGGMLQGKTVINANIELLGRHTKSDTFTMLYGYYSRLNDVLEDLDNEEFYEVIARDDVFGFNSLEVPVNAKLLIPKDHALTLEIDASFFVNGELYLTDEKSLTGNTQVSVTFGDDAILSGNGFTNFYRDGKQVKPKPGDYYHWGTIVDSDPSDEAWILVE